MEELKPCPFCGAGAGCIYLTFEHGYLDSSMIVFCDSCKISVKLEDNDQEGDTDETRRKAIEAWNRRAHDD